MVEVEVPLDAREQSFCTSWITGEYSIPIPGDYNFAPINQGCSESETESAGPSIFKVRDQDDIGKLNCRKSRRRRVRDVQKRLETET